MSLFTNSFVMVLLTSNQDDKEKFIPDHWSNFMVNFCFAYNMVYVYFRVDSPYFYIRSYFAEYFQIIF